jgi:signal transduction histidine kinase
MPKNSNSPGRKFFLFAAMLPLMASAFSVQAQVIANLQQLTQALSSKPHLNRDVRLEATVCAASRPEIGVLIVRDDTGVELLEVGNFGREIFPGEKIRIQGWYDLLRKREMGVELSASPVINNDGLHFARTWNGAVTLKAGKTPLRLGWFNCLREFDLEVYCAKTNGPRQTIAATNLWHAVVDESGRTNFLPGLRADYYEGYWESVPDFELFRPVKSGIVTNFDTGFRTRDEMFAVRFTGYFDAPADGQYLFQTRSDDGSLLFLNKPELPVVRTGSTDAPAATPALYGEEMQSLDERRWAEIEGRVSFVAARGEGLEFDLRSDRDVISVRVADAAGLEPSRLLNARVTIRGVAQGVLTTDQRIVLGKVFVASAKEIVFDEQPAATQPATPITTIGGVQSLPIEKARRALPVHIRGVVTDAKNSTYDRWMSIQDDTRGIFVSLTGVSNTPAFGEFWEVQGHSGAGDFAPVIVADKMTFLGDGRVPEPARPTWNELVNGSRDVQWAELVGLVTAVRSNTVTLLLPEGRLDVRLDGFFESDLKPFAKNVVRIRGVLYAMWDAATREVRVGNVMLRNATVNVDLPAPADPFDAVVKTPRELLLFDAQATAFRRVKVRGQIVHTDINQIFLMDDGAGLRILPAEKLKLLPGDLVEAVGYPDIGGTAILLREARVRKTGEMPLPPATRLTDLTQEGLDSTRVRVEGKLLGWHFERSAPVLEMQSGAHLYLARLALGETFSLPSGSRLALEGVYVGQGRNQRPGAEAESFELWLNSAADITVLSRPSWWTLQRLLIIVGFLLVVLGFALVWIKQLRRLVEQRTGQLQREIRERERVERQHALEAERSRIARDLHDDLGSSLTEISVLASTGQRPGPDAISHTNLFTTIAGKARSLIAALDVIVWAVDPEDNSLQSLGDYLTGYAEEFFSHTNISCRFKVPVSFPPITLEGRVRHDLLLAVKETLNNIVRHAEATEVEFYMAVAGDHLEIGIADNGKGFAGGQDGHGLKNLSARLLKLGGTCAVESSIGGGTTVKIRLPLRNL